MNKIFISALFISFAIHGFILTLVKKHDSNQNQVKFVEIRIKFAKDERYKNIENQIDLIQGQKLALSQLAKPENIQPNIVQQDLLKPKTQELKSNQDATKLLKKGDSSVSVNKLNNSGNLAYKEKLIKNNELKFTKNDQENIVTNHVPIVPLKKNKLVPEYTQTAYGNILGNTTDGEVTKVIPYEKLISLWFNKFRVYPKEAKEKGIVGSGIIFVKIDRSGKIIASRLKNSTGSKILDDSLIEMVRNANPVIPVPQDYHRNRDSFSYEIKFTFNND